MDWLLDPTVWAGLLTLVVLEIVLGIDNLVFIAILVDKLSPEQRDRARIVGLSLALLMRLGLLTVMSYLIQLTSPLFSVLDHNFSARDLILIGGGFFLLLKGTLELHERLEIRTVHTAPVRAYASFWVIVAQIVVLDAVFSIDAVVTAVGMVQHLPIMMAAVIIAIALMLLASKPLTNFVNSRPSVVMLCLCFLLMIGFSLLVEGFGFDVPKGYLYSAITFSILIESLNQLARRNLRLAEARRPMRERTAEAVLRMLGKGAPDEQLPAYTQASVPQAVFREEERNMVSGVLTLSERTAQSIMTPRNDVSWLNLNDPAQAQLSYISTLSHSMLPVCRGGLDHVVGIGRTSELLADLMAHGGIQLQNLREPVYVYESVGVLQLMGIIKQSGGQMVLVSDEFGAIEGLVTPLDIFEAIAGDFPDEGEMPDIRRLEPDKWQLDGATDLHHLQQFLRVDGLSDEHEEYTTLAGYLLKRFGQLPQVGDRCDFDWGNSRYTFTVLELDSRRIASVLLERHDFAPAVTPDIDTTY